MKNLSPQINNLKESLKNNQRYIAHQKKMKETMKYISIYTSCLRNSHIMSSSRTDLRNKETSEYDSEFSKTNNTNKAYKIEQDIDQIRTDDSSLPQHQKVDLNTEPNVPSEKYKDDYELPKIRNWASPKMKVRTIA